MVDTLLVGAWVILPDMCVPFIPIDDDTITSDVMLGIMLLVIVLPDMSPTPDIWEFMPPAASAAIELVCPASEPESDVVESSEGVALRLGTGVAEVSVSLSSAGVATLLVSLHGILTP